MNNWAAALFNKGLVRWTDAVRRAALLVVAAAILATAGIAAYVAENISINTDTADMLSPDLPFRRDSIALAKAFPQFSDNIVIVLDGDSADTVADAADRLAARLAQRPKLFGEIFDPAGQEFFRKNGLLFLDAQELDRVADRLSMAQPLLGTLARDPSLRGLFDVLGLALEKAADAPLEMDFVLVRLAAVVEAQVKGRRGRLSWQELMDQEPGKRRRIMVIQPALDFGSLQPAAQAIAAIRTLVRELNLDAAHGVTLRLTGSAPLAEEELESVVEGLGLAALLSVLLVTGLLYWGLRSVRMLIAALATLVMGLVWTAGFATLAVGRLNLISVAFAVLFIGLSVDFAIHYCLRVREGSAAGDDLPSALIEAAGSVGGALSLSAVAAAIGFFAFLPTDYLGLAELGLIAGAGMFIALFANLTLLPALLTILPPRPARLAAPAAWFDSAAQVRRARRWILWAALAIGIGAAAVMPQARFDFDPLNLRDSRTESVSTLFDLMKDPRAGPYAITVLAPDLETAAALGQQISDLTTVDGTKTLKDFVPDDQADKLAAIEAAALFLAPSLAVSPEPPPSTVQQRAALADFQQKLAAADGDGVQRLAAALAELQPAGGWNEAVMTELSTRLLGALPRQMAALKNALEARQVSTEGLPANIRAREIAADGRARLEIFPKEDMRDRAALERFVASVRKAAPDATGAPVIILEAGDAVVRAFVEAAILSVVLIALLVAVLLRGIKEIGFVFAPLGLAALLTVAASVLFGLPFNFANVIVLPLLFGLGVASGIHLILRERRTAGTIGVFRTSTPRAVVFSALTTMGSFGSIALSSHPGTASMGLLLTIAITATLLSTLIVLPALMATWPLEARNADGVGRARI